MQAASDDLPGQGNPARGNANRVADLVRRLVDDYGYHPGELTDATGEVLSADALESLVWAGHVEKGHGFAWTDLESEPTDLTLAELEDVHRRVAPDCPWSVRHVTSRHE